MMFLRKLLELLERIADALEEQNRIMREQVTEEEDTDGEVREGDGMNPELLMRAIASAGEGPVMLLYEIDDDEPEEVKRWVV